MDEKQNCSYEKCAVVAVVNYWRRGDGKTPPLLGRGQRFEDPLISFCSACATSSK
jgi:hypothetical protein